MKKYVMFLMILLLVFSVSGFVVAKDNETNSNETETEEDENETEVEVEIEDEENKTKIKYKSKERIKELKKKTKGYYEENVNGTRVRVKFDIKENKDGSTTQRLMYKSWTGEDMQLSTNLKLRERINNQTRKQVLTAILSNGNETNISIMPDKVKWIIQNKLMVGNITNMTLKEKKHKNIPRVVYNIEADKPGRFLGVFKLKMKVESEVDPETGEIIYFSKPWWAFLVSEPDEPLPVPGNETNQTNQNNETNTTEETNITITENITTEINATVNNTNLSV